MSDRTRDPALTTCLRDGCDGTIAHPSQRRSGDVRSDYCSDACVPPWLVGVDHETDRLGNYATRPFDTWLRSGEPMLMPTSDVPARFDGDGLGEESMADCLAELDDEPSAPDRAPTAPGAPKHHVICARCSEPVHKLHAVYPKRGPHQGGPYCADCVVAILTPPKAQESS